MSMNSSSVDANFDPPVSPSILQLDATETELIDHQREVAIATRDLHLEPLPASEAAPQATGAIVRETTTIALLEERLQVNYQRRKLGEITVRKKIETRIIEVPVRYETLIIEQVEPEPKLIAEINLADQDTDSAPSIKGEATIQGTFTSPRVASQMLYELGKSLHHTCRQIRVEVVLEDGDLQETYQQWLDAFIQNSRAE